ncbi:MAG: SpoIIE family protein phosphatase [Desulfobacterales bacterium]|jgi:sigma-B regulation protein RsbU (phosphoserine phosphatase)
MPTIKEFICKEDYMTAGKYILIINAAKSDLDQLVDILKPDYEIRVAIGEEKAFELVCSAGPPDLILLGIMSAEGDSRKICRRLKTDDITGEIPVILLSGQRKIIEETGLLEMGAADYILTPIYPPILRARLKTHLALKHSLEKLHEANNIIKTHDDKLEDELNVGRKIQLSMLPSEFPTFPDHDEFDVHAVLHPAREFGGNFYDFFFIGEDRFCFNIGDVSGKCIPAASFMSIAKSIIKSRAGDDFSTASILTHVNEELCEVNKTATYASLFMGILNIKTGLLVHTNAGHKPPFLKRAKGALEQLDRFHGPVIGAIKGLVYKEDKTVLSKNDMLMTYTDGVTAARDKAGRPFSDQRLADIMSSHEFQTAEDMVQATVSKVLAFENKSERLNDLTVLAVQFLRTPQETTGPKLELTVPNHVSENARVKQHFDTFAEHYNIPKQVRLKMHVVFDELLTNIISYAYPDGKEHDIGIKVELSADRLKVSMVDDGIPFNPLGVETPDTDLPLEEREIGGLGIHLVRRMMDKVSYRRRIDKNVITVYEYLEVDNE